MKLLYPINLVGLLAAALDAGHMISVEAVERHIEKATLLPYLRDAMGIDLISAYPAAVIDALHDRLRDVHIAQGRATYGIRNNGLCLLIAYANEINYRYVNVVV